MLKALIIPDCHRPYHHKRAYALMIKIARDLNPDEIVILGDYGDFYAVNSHGKDPRLMHMLLDEVQDINQGLDELDKLFPKARKRFLEGNHEYRLERYLTDNAPALFGVTSTPHLFNLHQRPGWTFHSYGPKQSVRILNSKLYAKHIPIGSGAKTTAQRAMSSVVFGHCHRIEEAQIVSLDGQNYKAFTPGWLGDSRQDQVFGYVQNHEQWSLGFAAVYVDPKTRFFYSQIIHILDNMTAVFNGKIYKG